MAEFSDYQMNWDAKIGVINISATVHLERDWHIVLPDSISFHTARITIGDKGTGVSEKDIVDMLDSGQPEEAAVKLAASEVDVIAFGCTAGSFLKGIGWDKTLAQKLEDACGGIPVVTTSTGLLSALETLNCKTITVASPYLEEVNIKEKAFLEGNGIQVLNIKGKQCADDHAIGAVTSEDFINLHLEMDSEKSDCAFITCTNSTSIEAIPYLEKKLGKPVLSSNQVTLWAALKKIGYKKPLKGWGILLEKYL